MPIRFPRPRFSIRFLLGLIAMAAALTWWFGMPGSVSVRFENAVHSLDYRRAGEMFLVDGTSEMLTQWPILSAQVVRPRPSLIDLARGRRVIHLTVKYREQAGQRSTGYFELEADRNGIHAMNSRPYEDAEFRLQ